MDELRLGDILVIQRERDHLTHRLVAIREAGIQTKGDRHPDLDPPVSPDSILGLVVAIERDGRRIELKKGIRKVANALFGKLGWWEARLFQLSPIASLPIRLVRRIILWVFTLDLPSLGILKGLE